MSDVHDFFAKRTAGGPALVFESASQQQMLAHPLLSRMLSGTRGPKGELETPIYRLTIWAGEGELRYCFAAVAQGKEEVWFGAAGPDADVLGSIERSLREGRLELKREKPSRVAKAVY